MTSYALRQLVEESAVPLLTERINSLQTTVHNLQSMMFKLERDFQGYIKVTQDLAEEMQKHLAIRSAHLAYTNASGKQRYHRDFQSVKNRWLTWRRMIVDEGMPTTEVAKQFGVSHEAIKHAMKQKFMAKPTTNSLALNAKRKTVGRLGGG